MSKQHDISGTTFRRLLAMAAFVVLCASLGTFVGARLIQPKDLLIMPASYTIALIDPECSFSKRLLQLDELVRKTHWNRRYFLVIPIRGGPGLEAQCRTEQQSLAETGQVWIHLFAESIFCNALVLRGLSLHQEFNGQHYPYFVRDGEIVAEGLSVESLARLGAYGEHLASVLESAGKEP